MKTRNLKPYLIAAILGAAAPLAMAEGDYHKDDTDKGAMEKTGDYISDAALTTKINAALVAEGELSALDIEVDSNDGMVTLSGAVDNEAQIDLAERVVEDLDGVKSVNNDLVARGS